MPLQEEERENTLGRLTGSPIQKYCSRQADVGYADNGGARAVWNRLPREVLGRKSRVRLRQRQRFQWPRLLE